MAKLPSTIQLMLFPSLRPAKMKTEKLCCKKNSISKISFALLCSIKQLKRFFASRWFYEEELQISWSINKLSWLIKSVTIELSTFLLFLLTEFTFSPQRHWRVVELTLDNKFRGRAWKQRERNSVWTENLPRCTQLRFVSWAIFLIARQLMHLKCFYVFKLVERNWSNP